MALHDENSDRLLELLRAEESDEAEEHRLHVHLEELVGTRRLEDVYRLAREAIRAVDFHQGDKLLEVWNGESLFAYEVVSGLRLESFLSEAKHSVLV